MASAGTDAKGGNGEYTIEVNGQKYAVKVSEGIDGNIEVSAPVAAATPAAAPAAAPSGSGTEVKSNVAGNVWKILVNVGDDVVTDQEVAILEAMKMEFPIVSPVSGKVTSITVKPNDGVSDGQVLMVVS
jgi:biotin carboxyl carrier protein